MKYNTSLFALLQTMFSSFQLAKLVIVVFASGFIVLVVFRKLNEFFPGKQNNMKKASQDDIDTKNKEWLASKNLELKKQKQKEENQRLAEEKERIEKEKKRTEAEKQFLSWKEKKQKEFKDKIQKEKDEAKKREEELLEKRKDADQAFNSWKMQKKEEMKQKQEKLKAKEDKDKEQSEVLVLVKPAEEVNGDNKTGQTPEPEVSVIEQKKVQKTDDKLEEAKLAYEAWLDYIEARDEERLMFEEERRKILMWKPPWYPGGKTMF